MVAFGPAPHSSPVKPWQVLFGAGLGSNASIVAEYAVTRQEGVGGWPMTVNLELEPEVESLLVKRAKADGCDLQDYVKKLIRKDVDRKRTFDEILAPFRQAVERSSISDDELDSLFTEARRDVFKAKQVLRSN